MNLGSRVEVIEPHPDDAFLSLGWSLQEWIVAGCDVEIVTVYSTDPVREAEVSAWASSIGATWRGLSHPNYTPNSMFVENDVVDELAEPLLPPRPPDLVRIWPLGLTHPEHKEVARHAAPDDLRYIDTPYQMAQHSRVRVQAAVEGRAVAWWRHPPIEKWSAAAFFASQSLLFAHHTPERLQGLPEVVLR